ncbi:ead/Ea22-like family protein [Salmonella enterica subsp. enterica serovar Halle]|nr:ead/Ea22-like family protein [Salmonella enterica subsp. enterica serovar Halle]
MNIDKRALREVAEKATPGNWRRTSSLFNGITVTPFSLCGEEVTLAHTVEKRDAEFIAAANPATMLALLDENIQLQREKDAIEAVALALRDDMRQARKQLADAGRLIADLDKCLIEYAGIATREARRVAELGSFHTAYLEWSDKTEWVQTDKRFDVIKPWGKHRADVLREYIEHLEARQIALPQRLSPEGYHIDEAYMVDDAEGEYLDRDAVIEAISAAGIKVI